MSGPDPYKLESLVLERDTFRLLQLIHASRSLHERAVGLRSEAKGSGLDGYTRIGSLSYLLNWEESEASRLVLNLAIIIRNSLDHSPLLPGEDDVCGIILRTSEGFASLPPKSFPRKPSEIWRSFKREGLVEEPLEIRETCNKLVHAKGVEWERKQLDVEDIADRATVPYGRFLTGFVLLYGERPVKSSREHWVAYVNVERFCLATVGQY
jgi:hypothetical protein